MKIDRYTLTQIYDVAHKEMVNSVKSKYESHQQHLARCWTVALLSVLKINNVTIDVEKNLAIEPLED